MSKEQEVLAELKPIADVLNVKLEYVIDDENKREYLVCNDTKICTNNTSVYGIRQEFFGYVFLLEWHKRSLGTFNRQLRNFIRQYWYNDEFEQPYARRN